MTVKPVRAEKLPALLLLLIMVGAAVLSCAPTGLRTVSPSNAPPDISHRMRANDELAHQGISIGGRGYSGHEIVAPSEGIVVLSSGTHVRIHHGMDSKSQDVYTEHFHLHGRLPNEGDTVRRGENIGLIGPGKNTHLPHYHYVVVKREGPQTFIALDPSDYWLGIDEYKEKLGKGLYVGSFVIPCFNPSVNYPKESTRFTYPVKCN